jgi:hypothetical protein
MVDVTLVISEIASIAPLRSSFSIHNLKVKTHYAIFQRQHRKAEMYKPIINTINPSYYDHP